MRCVDTEETHALDARIAHQNKAQVDGDAISFAH